MSTSAREAQELDRATRLRASLMKLSRWVRANETGSGLTPAELSAMAVIVRRGPIRPSELARHEGVNPTMLSRLLGHLFDAGVLHREVDPLDRRTTLVVPTAKGRRLVKRVRSERARALESLLARLPVADQDAIVGALPALEALADIARAERR